ncbi:MAG: hypothetical protein COA93_00290 [Alphaproteobacteria bacterium]|nr:MAG: hypothetical protein COA93_00290 [Alphaproteobacteria bacterium]
MKIFLLYVSILLGFSAVLVSSAYAQKKDTDKFRPIVPCAHPMFRALDFWVGDWQVYHKDSGKLAGFDRVGRTLKGCAIQQSWISLDDHFSSPMVPFRMNGKSLTAFDGQNWTQFWVDNQAGSQVIKGNFEGDRLILKSETPIMSHIYKLTWQQKKDGTVEHIAQRKKQGEEIWHILFDFIYRKNISHVANPE